MVCMRRGRSKTVRDFTRMICIRASPNRELSSRNDGEQPESWGTLGIGVAFSDRQVGIWAGRLHWRSDFLHSRINPGLGAGYLYRQVSAKKNRVNDHGPLVRSLNWVKLILTTELGGRPQTMEQTFDSTIFQIIVEKHSVNREPLA